MFDLGRRSPWSGTSYFTTTGGVTGTLSIARLLLLTVVGISVTVAFNPAGATGGVRSGGGCGFDARFVPTPLRGDTRKVPLAPDQTCTVKVGFQPVADGEAKVKRS